MSTTSSPGRRPFGKPALSPPSTPSLLCAVPGVGAIARIVGRLPAACLRCRDAYLGPTRFQQADRGEPDRRSHQVDEAGDEQTDAHGADDDASEELGLREREDAQAHQRLRLDAYGQQQQPGYGYPPQQPYPEQYPPQGYPDQGYGQGYR